MQGEAAKAPHMRCCYWTMPACLYVCLCLQERERSKADAMIEEMETQWRAVDAEIAEKEYNFLLVKHEEENAGPSSDEDWEATMRKDLRMHRDGITDSKIKAIFEVRGQGWRRGVNRHAS